MSNQTFKKPFPNELLIELLDNISSKTEKYYIINNDSYKKGIFTNKIIEHANYIGIGNKCMHKY